MAIFNLGGSNRYPRIAPTIITWTPATFISLEEAPTSSDGVEGDMAIVADFPGGSYWPPQLYGPKDNADNWPLVGQLPAGPTPPNNETSFDPPYYYYEDENGAYLSYASNVENALYDGYVLFYDSSEQWWVPGPIGI